MPRRNTARSSRRRDAKLNWRRAAISMDSTFREDTSIPTDIVTASTAGAERAWEIYRWYVACLSCPDIPGAGAVDEVQTVQLNHLTGQSAFPNIGENGYIDQMLFWATGTATDVTNHGYAGEGPHRNIYEIYGEAEIFVDDTMHIYHQNTWAAARSQDLALGFLFVKLTSKDLLELLQKYQ